LYTWRFSNKIYTCDGSLLFMSMWLYIKLCSEN